MTDHHVYIWRAGYKTFVASRCQLRLVDNPRIIVDKATSATATAENMPTDDGIYKSLDITVTFETASLGENKIELDQVWELEQPPDSNQKRVGRVRSKMIYGGLTEITLESVNG